MSKIIEYFNNNAFVASLITLCLSTLITVIINIINKTIDRREKEIDIKREEFHNKGELRIDKSKNIKFNDRINLIYSSYKAKNEKCMISKSILNSNNLDYIYLPITNIGKIAINEMYITVNNRKTLFLVENERIKGLVKEQYVNFVVPYYNKILPNESILIDLNFLKGDKVFGSFSSELTFYYKDDYGNLYYQPLFLRDRRFEGPYKIADIDYIKKTSLII